MRIALKYGIAPLVPIFISFCIGVVLGRYLTNSQMIALFLFPAVYLALVISFILKKRNESNHPGVKTIHSLTLIALAAVSGYAISWYSNNLELPPNHISKFTDQGLFYVTGIVDSEPDILNSIDSDNRNKRAAISSGADPTGSVERIRFRLEVKCITTEERGRVTEACGAIQLNIYKSTESYEMGDMLRFRGKILPIRNFNNPGGFDYVRYMKEQDIYARSNIDQMNVISHSRHDGGDFSGYAGADRKNVGGKNVEERIKNLAVMAEDYLNWLNGRINRFREDFSMHVFSNAEDSDSASVLCALTVGKKRFITDDLMNDFSRSGASHVLAVSGMHLSIVAALFFYLFNRLLSLSEKLLIRGWSAKGAAILTLWPVVTYSIVSGHSDATLRSMIMVVIFMVAAVIDRESDSFNSLAAAGLVILSADSDALFSISFQLSFTAVFFILFGVAAVRPLKKFENVISRFSERCLNRMPFKNCVNAALLKLSAAIFISLCAVLGTEPIVMYYFNILSLAGPITNITFVPVIGMFILPLGMASLSVYPFSAELSGLIIRSAAFILDPLLKFIRFIANCRWSSFETYTPDFLEMICLYTAVISIFILMKNKNSCNNITAGQNGVLIGKDQRLKYGIYHAAVIVALILLLFDEAIHIKHRFTGRTLSATVLDVGQGAAALIEAPGGKIILVDGGGFSYKGSFDTGKNIISPMLRQKRIFTVDAIILTHPDSDHITGLVYILNHFSVKRVIKNCYSGISEMYIDFMNGVAAGRSEVVIVNNHSERVMKIGEIEVHFFHPLEPCSDESVTKHNNNSVVFKVVYKKFSILFPGDIALSIEKMLADEYGILLKSDIMIAPHHGSAGSNSVYFIERIDPEAVIISCGWKNRFGFPKDIVLKRYRKRAIDIYRTDLDGAVNVFSDGSSWKINSFQATK